MTRLDEIVAHIHNKHVYIQTHNFPDPDAISSAFGLQELLSYKGIPATICYKGKIDRYNTQKLIEMMNIQLEDIGDLEDVLDVCDEIILVDAQKGNSNIINSIAEEIICIDHHPTFEKADYQFSDIRPEFGACASIIAQYYFENKIPMSKSVATALSYGIRSDTDRLARGVCKADLEMLCRMFDMANHSVIQQLENKALFFDDLIAYSEAIESIKVYDNISFACTLENCPEALIASVSDFMLALVEVEFSIVCSVRRDGIKISVRSEEKKFDAGKITSKVLEGIGNGGGHPSMAGGFIPEKSYGTQAEQMLDKLKESFAEILHQIKLADSSR